MLSRAFALSLCLIAPGAWAFETQARSAYIFDQTTGTVLLEKNAEEPLPPASMSKLMTLYMAFEAIQDGRLRLDEVLPVSEHAMSFGGSTMFLDTTDRVSVEDLLRGIIVLSGNDACVVIAEALSIDGTEAGFARQMTERAREMGMANSTFMNASGWPAVGHRMSMEDLGILADRLISDFPTFYPLFAEREFEFDGRAPSNTLNRNPLLARGLGDGLKTGHTQEAGFGLVGSSKQGDRRVIFVISGLDSRSQRSEESQRIVNWAFRQFETRALVSAGTEVARADVWMGTDTSVGVAPAEDVVVLLPRGVEEVAAEVVYQGPLETPIAAGDPVAELVISAEGLPASRHPLIATRDVPVGGFGPRLRTAALYLMDQISSNLGSDGS